MSRILVFSELSDAVSEMLSEARRLADQAPDGEVVAIGWGDPDEWARHGADVVIGLEPLPAETPTEAVVPTLAQVAGEAPTTLVLVAGTKRGKGIAAQLAAALDAPYASDATSVEIAGERVSTSRLMYGGLAARTEGFDRSPVIATFAPRTFSATENPRQATVRSLPVPTDGKVRVVERRPRPVGVANVETADVVIGVGRGVQTQDDFQLACELASALGGAVGCTRPIAEDLKWLPVETYIGLSGVKLRSRLYIALGVSGQIQHVTGIRDVKLVLAVNNDENSPIWESADYGIVGDVHEVVPRLTAEFRRALG